MMRRLRRRGGSFGSLCAGHVRADCESRFDFGERAFVIPAPQQLLPKTCTRFRIIGIECNGQRPQRDRRRMKPSPLHPISAETAQLDNAALRPHEGAAHPRRGGEDH